MSRVRLQLGIRYESKGRPLEIVKVHDGEGRVEVRDLSTGLSSTIDAHDIVQGLLEEEGLRFEVSGKSKRPVVNGWFSTAYQTTDFEGAGNHKQEAWDRYRIVRAVLECLSQGDDWTTAYGKGLKKASTESALVLKTPSMRTVQRWVSRFVKGDLDPRSLAPHGKRRTKSTFPSDVEEAMSAAITQKYLTERGPHLEGAYLALMNIIADRNATTDGIMEGLTIPSRSTFYRRLRRVDPVEVAASRHGAKKAREQYGGFDRGVEVERVNERWEMDHTTLDLLLVDEEDGRPMGRPTLSFAIDRFSRSPMGFYLGFDPLLPRR